MPNLSYRKASYDLFSDLDDRTKDILTKRFGFETKAPFTLEKIGKEHHITRERVRQIVDDAIDSIKEKIQKKQVKSALFDIFSYFSDALDKSGHLKREDLLLKSLGEPESFPYITFLLHLGDQFLKHKETNDIHQYWALEKEIIERVSDALKELLNPATAQSEFQRLIQHAQDHHSELGKFVDGVTALVEAEAGVIKRLLADHEAAKLAALVKGKK